ncbi:MAG: hypothetical protein H7A43_06055 [Verrucomicrobia bacterium]|nr:hypothetical protein [Verrucomicrobiota bacterium]
MKFLSLLVIFVLVGTGCTERADDHWYEESVSHNQERDGYVQEQIASGLTPEEARAQHDRRTWALQTIQMAREEIHEAPDDEDP